VTPPEYELRIQSTIPEGAALIIVTGAKPGRFEVTIAGRTHTYVHPSVGHRDRSIIRDSLFQVLAADTGLPVTFEQRGYTGIALLPARNGQLPPIAVHNDDHQLDVVHGTMLHVRIEQCAQRLSFLEREVATIGYNATPFLINLPGQWSSRPGIFTPSQLTFEDKVLRPGREERVSYRISNKRWVAAGTYMATTTQLTTMESANESARHAVNAILRCLAFRQGDDYNSQGRVFADLADIWDPEQNELTDLEPLKRLDRKLCNEGLPHVLDILKIIEYVDAMPMHGTPSRDPMANVLHLFQHIADGSDHDWSFLKQSLGDLLGQAVERSNDMVDPFGVLRELRHGTSAVTDKIRDFLMSAMTGRAPGSPPKP
jgi:hypothetical protein